MGNLLDELEEFAREMARLSHEQILRNREEDARVKPVDTEYLRLNGVI